MLAAAGTTNLNGLKFINPYIGIHALYLQQVAKEKIVFNSNITEPITLFLNEAGHLDHIDATGAAWNFLVQKTSPLDIEHFTKRFAKKPEIGDPSPHEKFTKTVRSAAIAVDYGRPSKRGREIFGHIVPYGVVWRTGAGAPTKVKFDKDLDFGGTIIPKGEYNLFTLPQKNSWILIFNTEPHAWGSVYKPEYDTSQVKMQVKRAPAPVEKFTIEIDEGRGGGVIRFLWDTTEAYAKFKVKK